MDNRALLLVGLLMAGCLTVIVAMLWSIFFGVRSLKDRGFISYRLQGTDVVFRGVEIWWRDRQFAGTVIVPLRKLLITTHPSTMKPKFSYQVSWRKAFWCPPTDVLLVESASIELPPSLLAGFHRQIKPATKFSLC